MLTLLQVWNTSVPVWALLLSIILPAIYVLPSGFIFAMTGQGVSFFFRPAPVLGLIYVIDHGEPTRPNHSRYTVARKSSGEHSEQSYTLSGG